jgi:DNA-binding GntR family transcriptional regulator
MAQSPNKPRKHTAPPTDQDIYLRIFQAILERRLQPGAHLRESELAEMFGVSRTKVRQALMRLIQMGVVDQQPNKGATVAKPTRKQAREIFELRGLLEPALAARVAEGIQPDQLQALHAHIADEENARNLGDDADLIRLTGEFHVLLARLLDNQLLEQQLLAVEALTCLSILAYTRSGASACLSDEHRHIVDAIEAGQVEKVRDLMAAHLDHVRADLDLHEPLAVNKLSDALRVTGRRAGARV